MTVKDVIEKIAAINEITSFLAAGSPNEYVCEEAIDLLDEYLDILRNMKVVDK